MCAFIRIQYREINRSEFEIQVWYLPNNKRVVVSSSTHFFDVPLSIPGRSLVIPAHCEIARIVEIPRTIICFCPKKNRYILDVKTNPATGLRKAWWRRETITVFCILRASERPPNVDRYIAHRYLQSLGIAYNSCIKWYNGIKLGMPIVEMAVSLC